ncbi:MAG: hypothetical protein QXJ21_05245 [Thermofilum sp.]
MGYRYEVAIERLDVPLKVDKELARHVKETLGKVPRKMLSEMEKEAVQCPVLRKQVPFLQCYTCRNFVRRVRGMVHCKGDPLS